MANKTGKSIDKTFLSINNAEARGFIHRDYIAHCLRWSHVMKFLGNKYSTARILDIGCGKEAPLAKMLYSSKMPPELYVGIDYGKVEPDISFGKYSDLFEFFEHEDAAEWDAHVQSYEKFNVITCFEMLEHIEPEHVLRTLDQLRKNATEDADIFISTPCFNGKAAANHVNEMTYAAMAHVLQQQGFHIKNRYGTFASISDYKGVLAENDVEIFETMRAYFDVNVLACIFAPLYPAQSRNVLWHVTPTDKMVMNWDWVDQPWSSSDKWKELKA